MKVYPILLFSIAPGIQAFGADNVHQADVSTDSPGTKSRPNIVVILTDDQGYSDVGVYGAVGFKTPNADRMARQGISFTDFYMASGLSTPSRAALLTGCYPPRVDMGGVLFPDDRRGINPDETTLAEMLAENGYDTGYIGKWHLGHVPQALPLRHGFQEFFGVPYSVDMIPLIYPGQTVPNNSDRSEYPPFPLYNGEEVLEYNPLLASLTTRYTEYAVDYIHRHKDAPFLLYFAHSMPHVPLAVSDKFKGKSKLGLYGDVMMEIDWSIGEIYKALERNGIADNTLVIFTSDNGPWLQMGNHGGHAGPLRLGKGNTFDGGHKVFCLMTWPGTIPEGSVCRYPVSSTDLFPTIANITGSSLPEAKIDGEDITCLLTMSAPEDYQHGPIFFYGGAHLNAVRLGDWKYHISHAYWQTIIPGKDGFRGAAQKYICEPSLYNLKEDVSESRNLINSYPQKAEELKAIMDAFDKDLKESKRFSVVYPEE